MLKFDRHERALHLYTLSSHQGNVDSYVRVGDYYYYGRGTNVSFDESVRNYRAAATMRNPRAMFNLGYMHENGLGLPQDFHLAKRCVRLHHPLANTICGSLTLVCVCCRTTIGTMTRLWRQTRPHTYRFCFR